VIDQPTRRKGRWRRFFTTGSLDIQSKLLVMLLGVSVLAALVIGAVGYVNGRNALQTAALNQVTSLRESRITELKRSFNQFTQTVVSQSRNASVIGATKAFTSGWDDLQDTPVSASDRSKVDGWYQDTFVPQLDASSGGTANPEQFAPTQDPQAYLQAGTRRRSTTTTRPSSRTTQATAAPGPPRTPSTSRTSGRSSRHRATRTSP